MSRFSGNVLRTDLLSGLLFVAIGVACIAIAADYPFGTAMTMGPGYFPVMLASMLIVLGVVLVGRDLVSGSEPVTDFRLRPLLAITVAVLCFAFLVEPFGLVVATAALVFGCMFTKARPRAYELLLLYGGLLIFAKLVFVDFLGIPLRMLP